MPWATAVMKEGAIMVFVEAILREHSEREKEISLREKGDGGGRR